MKTKVEISDQVLNFVRSLAPEPRRSLRLALRGLEDERGDMPRKETFYYAKGIEEFVIQLGEN